MYTLAHFDTSLKNDLIFHVNINSLRLLSCTTLQNCPPKLLSLCTPPSFLAYWIFFHLIFHFNCNSFKLLSQATLPNCSPKPFIDTNYHLTIFSGCSTRPLSLLSCTALPNCSLKLLFHCTLPSYSAHRKDFFTLFFTLTTNLKLLSKTALQNH